jgi:hypothetical protein
MKKNKIVSSVFGYLALTSGSIWFGAYISRLITTYQLFEPTELTLKEFITNSILLGIVQTTFPLVILTFFSYLIFIICFTVFLITIKLKLKENGWLFIISMIIYITFPFEAILMIIDYKLIVIFFSELFTSEQILGLIIERLTMLSSFPIIMILSYLSIPYFIIFKPFGLKTNNEN